MEWNEQINKAIFAHGRWKGYLRQAIESRSREFAPALIRQDDRCDFGKWLAGQVPLERQREPLYPKVKQLHATLHIEAARIMELALAGNTEAAYEALAARSHFAHLSAELTLALMKWKDS